MRARSTLICSVSALFCASSSSTSSFKLSWSSESSVSGGIPNLNQPPVMRSMPKARVKPTQTGEQLPNTMNGSPIDTHMNNVTIANVAPGAYAYGESDEFDCTNCVLSSITPLGFSTSVSSAGYTMQNGIISSNDTNNGPVSWAVPGKTWRELCV